MMTPNITSKETILPDAEETFENMIKTRASPREYKIVYRNIIVFLYYHLAGLYGLYLCFAGANLRTISFAYIVFWIAGLGVTAGSHRLWSHKSYKATRPLQLLLMLCHSVANQNSVLHWVRDHRLHHKYSDTDADPHNASRGFFYSHVGWLMVRKHPDVVRTGKILDLSDIFGNPILHFQYKNSYWFIPLVSFVLPTLIPVYFWGETYTNAWHLNMLRYTLNLNFTFFVNSFAHMWGNKPYDKHIRPSQSHSVSFLTLGEGFHNYHHVFPWDYRSDELSGLRINPTTIFIDICSWLGLAYDRKSAPRDMIRARSMRTGDGSRHFNSYKISM